MRTQFQIVQSRSGCGRSFAKSIVLTSQVSICCEIKSKMNPSSYRGEGERGMGFLSSIDFNSTVTDFRPRWRVL